MEEDLERLCYEKKTEIMWDALSKISSLRMSYGIAIQKKFDDTKKFLCDLGENEHLIFSDYRQIFDENYNLNYNIQKEFFRSLALKPAVKNGYTAYERYLNPDFRFADDIEAFVTEFFNVTVALMFKGDESDPRIGLAVMKALFHAGGMIERFEQEGKKRSDIPVKAGSSSWKKKVSKQDVIEMFYRVDTEGKSKNAICEAVQEALVSREAKRGEKKRDVYSTKSIGRILKEELEKVL